MLTLVGAIGADVAIRARIDATAPEVLEQTRRNADEFVWKDIASIEELRALRLGAMGAFLQSYETSASAGRYVAGGGQHCRSETAHSTSH